MIKSIKYSIKQFIRKTRDFIKNIFSFSYVWVALILLILCFISLLLSKYYNDMGNNFNSSIFSNIFTGIVTGIVLLLVTNLKNVQLIRLCFLNEQLNIIHKSILDYSGHIRKLELKQVLSEKDYDDIYDAICMANNINIDIIYNMNKISLGINLNKIFIRSFNFDAHKQEIKCGEIREDIIHNSCDIDEYEKLIQILRDYRNELFELNSKILNKIKENDIKIDLINKSII